eukprot:COSAG02_NODE_759_length_17490_cov_29.152608_9_plen_123_part_00
MIRDGVFVAVALRRNSSCTVPPVLTTWSGHLRAAAAADDDDLFVSTYLPAGHLLVVVVLLLLLLLVFRAGCLELLVALSFSSRKLASAGWRLGRVGRALLCRFGEDGWSSRCGVRGQSGRSS